MDINDDGDEGSGRGKPAEEADSSEKFKQVLRAGGVGSVAVSVMGREAGSFYTPTQVMS